MPRDRNQANKCKSERLMDTKVTHCDTGRNKRLFPPSRKPPVSPGESTAMNKELAGQCDDVGAILQGLNCERKTLLTAISRRSAR